MKWTLDTVYKLNDQLGDFRTTWVEFMCLLDEMMVLGQWEYLWHTVISARWEESWAGRGGWAAWPWPCLVLFHPSLLNCLLAWMLKLAEQSPPCCVWVEEMARHLLPGMVKCFLTSRSLVDWEILRVSLPIHSFYLEKQIITDDDQEIIPNICILSLVF